MGKVTVSTFVTLDGVMQDPGPNDEFDHSGWQMQFFDDEAGQIARDGLFAVDALLLGRVTYDHFAAAWPQMTDEQGYAERMNGLPKYVASKTLTDPVWNATVIDDPPADVARLKQDNNLLVMGSGQLVATLREQDLVDEYEVWIHPILLGDGQPLFAPGPAPRNLNLTDVKTTPKGVAILRYEIAV